MKDNSQAMLVLVVAARTGGTNNLYYWTESRQKKQTPSVLLLVGLRPAAASWRLWPWLAAAVALLVLAQFVEVGHQPQSGLISS